MIYVHVPFCRSFCTYCGFYSEICSRKETQQVQNRLFENYAEALCDEIDSRREYISAARGLSSAETASSEIVGSGNRGTGNFLRTLPKQALVPPSYVAEGGTVSSTPVPGTEGGTSMQQEIPTSPDTLYIGGGTPSVLPLAVLERIVGALGPATYREFTVEVNPDDIVAGGAEYVAGLLALGVNRVSMGVQSFDDGILRWMNRRHDAAGAREAFRLLRAGGFDNVSIDLIFGLSQLTGTIWESTIDKALELGPEHISAYQLSIEEDSVLEKMVADGRYTEASDEQCRGQYDTLCRKLAEAGYVHYEISNWARPGREAVHNSAYWRRVPYVGLGPGAHSFFGGVRSWNSQELPRREADGRLVRWRSGHEALSEREAAEETVMLGLRTAAGLPLSRLRDISPVHAVDALLAEGALMLITPVPDTSDAPFIRIPEDHFFVSDDIIARLLP
ncbi:MAG: coproporphyrinogen III oxidase family protein [Bacteroidales bacterium]|nr:coproporphyrinogen III oxidase family protein [Bacteroidales bacterium]